MCNTLIMLKYLLILTVNHCYGAEMSWVQEACSAMDSYFMISVDSQRLTIPSTQALFPPNSYYIPPIPIALLSSNDNPCLVSQINTDITNKMVLLYTSTDCSDHQQAYVAEENGAIAVLISSDGNTQQSITGTNELNTSVPVRGITKDVADVISAHVLDLNKNVTGTFACDFTEHPITICVVDGSDGTNWRLDGEYIRDFDQSINSHPVWHKYGYYVRDFYIYLHTANRSTEWFWAITIDKTFESDASIRAYCAVGGDDVKEPSDCPLWRATNGTNLGQLDQYKAKKNLTVSAHVCIWEDQYICVKSTQSTLAGLQGTYRLNHKNIPLWLREMDECDGSPGMILKDDEGALIVYDWVDDWTVAQCNGSIEDELIAFTPQTCTPWKTLQDNTLDSTQMENDATVSITEGKCDANTCAIYETPADTICLSNSTVLHSFLEGTYVKTGVAGDDMQYVEYVKAQPLFDEDGTQIKSYLWYFGEFTDQIPWWILTPQNLTFALENNGYGVGYYGYTACSVQNVANCNSLWNFYWGVTDASHSDASFRITEGNCAATTTRLPPDYGDEYEYICLDIPDQDVFESETELNYDQFRGAYKIKYDERDMPYWEKPVNDYTDMTTYIYYEKAFKYWRVDTSLARTGMICESDELYPNACSPWYDTIDGSALNETFAFRIDGCSYDDVLERSCSAMHSWLQISGYIDVTLTSSQALFEPYFYRTKPTEIVRLSTDDNPCDIDEVSTDVSGKMVLLFTSSLFGSDISCSDHYQLYVMEQLGATSAIMSDQDNAIEAIQDDDTAGITTTIPMRGISLYKAVDLAAVIDNGKTIYGSFSCNDSFQYPLTICASQVGLNIYGDFQYQTNIKYNDHPVWIREGYSIFTGYQDTYLYLHNGNGDRLWYWAITMDDMLSDDDEMIAYCAYDGDIAVQPTDCAQWMVLQVTTADDDDDDEESETIEWLSSDMLTSDGLCNVSDNYFCITSEQSELAGLEGTYRLYYEDEPVWFRERDACDHNPAVFVYEDGLFYLLDPMDDWIVASCYIGDRLPWVEDDDWEEYEQHFAFHPELCSIWYTLDDNSLDDQQSYDNTLFIEPNCNNSREICVESDDEPPDTLCLTQNSVMHSFLEGEYAATGTVGDVYNTKEYKRSEQLYYDGDAIDVWLWFYGEVPDKSPWWILSSHNMSVGLKRGYGIAFGYAACSLLNPADCKTTWNFYYGRSAGKGNWHSDTQFTLSEDKCEEPVIVPANYSTQYEYLCIDILDDEYNASHIFKGGYKINTTSTPFSGDTPFWVKPVNDYYNEEIYIYYDEFYGYWQIGKGLHIDTLLVCMSDTQYPEQCGNWYDDLNNLMTSKLILRSEGCSKDDMLRQTKEKNNLTRKILVVLLIIVCVFTVFGAGLWIYNKCVDKRRDTDGYSTRNNVTSTEMGGVGSGSIGSRITKKKKKKKKKKRGHTQLAIGSDEDEDGALTGVTTRGYDMSPLQREKDSSRSVDNSDDDSTLEDVGETNDGEDQQENDINDEEDGMLIN